MTLTLTIRRCVLATLLIGFALPVFAQSDKPLNAREVRRYLSEAEKRMEDGKLEEAGGLYLRVLEDFPERGDVRLEVARIYRQMENWTQLANECEKAVETLEEQADIAECYEGMTLAYSLTANYTKAVEVGRRAFEMNPESADVAIGLATGLAKTGELTEAADIAAKALELAPDNAFVHTTLGEAALAEGDYAKARGSFERALELEPNTAVAHAGMAGRRRTARFRGSG